MKTHATSKRSRQRGATLTGYALTLATFGAAGLSTMSALEESSGEFLTDTGDHIGEARPDQYELETTILGGSGDSTSTTAESTTTTVAATVTTAPTTTQAPQSYPSGDLISEGVLQPITDGMCIAVDADNVVRQFGCDPASAPQIQVHERPDGYITLSYADGTCLGATGGPTDNAAVVKNQTCTESPEQLWRYTPSYGGSYNLTNVYNNRCLDVSGNSTSSGAQLITWSSEPGSCKTSDSPNNHQFTIYSSGAATPTTTTTPAPTADLTADASEAVLTGAMTTNNGRVGSYHGLGENYSGAQDAQGSATFTFTVTEAGTYMIKGTDIQVNGGSSDSFWVYVDGQPGGTGYKWFTNSGDDWINDHQGLGDLRLDLAPGEHTVTLFIREDDTWIGGVELVKQ